MKYYKKILILILVVLAISLFCKNSFAGASHILSRNADYSTDDRAFLNTDTLYVQVTQNIIDYKEIKKSFFTLKSHKTKNKTKYPLIWNSDLTAFTGLATLDHYPVGDKITIHITLRGKNAKDEIKRKDRFVIGNAGKWTLTGTIYEKTSDKGTGTLANARVRIQGVADINTADISYYPKEDDKFILSGENGNFAIDYEGISGQVIVITAGKEGYKNTGKKITLGHDNGATITLSPVPAEDHPSYDYRSSKSCEKCHSTIYNDWQDSDMAYAAVNPINQLIFLLYTAWYVTGDRTNFTDPSIFNDPNPAFVGDKGKIFEDATGRYKILGDAGHIHDCADCHSPSYASKVQDDGVTPLWDMRAGILSDVDKLSFIDKQGVHCDFCHKMHKVHDEEEYWTEPGVNYKVNLLRPDPLLESSQEGKIMFGPFDDVIYNSMQASFVSQFKKSEICSPCHQDARKLYLQPLNKNGQPEGDAIERILWSEDTYREWRFSGYSGLEADYPVNNYAGKVLQCQDCHMKDPPPDPATGKSIADYTEVTDPFFMISEEKRKYATKRDPRTVYPHRFEGTNQNLSAGKRKRYLDWAVDLTVTNAQVKDGILSFDVNVINSHTGHTYPSGVTQRNVVLLAEATQSGTALTQSNDQTVDTPGGSFPEGYYEGKGDYAGKPGKIFIKHNRMVVDNEELSPFFYDVLYAYAVEELYDTRIKANQTDTTHYEFQTIDTSKITITARLIYRFLPKGTLEFAAENGYVISLEENDYESHKVETTLEP
ncbi:MAG: hypothetical protein E3K36_15215 [Candidatus Brocadia sp.]|nr:hypothetical protein [Candidatus Brocadia sp.]